jgi:hypothetical protein
MFKSLSAVLFALIAFVLVAGATSQEPPAKSKADVIGAVGGAGTKVPRIALPSGWSKLFLSEEQKLKVYDVRRTFQGKIADLNKQLDETRTAERSELLKILTDEQKTRLMKTSGF